MRESNSESPCEKDGRPRATSFVPILKFCESSPQPLNTNTHNHIEASEAAGESHPDIPESNSLPPSMEREKSHPWKE